jgi:lysine 2,3-aminomutase
MAQPSSDAIWHRVTRDDLEEAPNRRTERPQGASQLPDIAGPRFPVSDAADVFRRRYFQQIPRSLWNDWRWQLRSRLKSLQDLTRVFTLSEDEAAAVQRHSGSLPVGITPYYAHLLDLTDSTQGLRRTHIPATTEYVTLPGETSDPLDEDGRTTVPGLVHRYPDRVLFLVTGSCSTYCRYCTRSRLVGDPGGPYSFSMPQWEQALSYIEAHPQIRDVLLSGGDPLIIATEKLDWLLGRLRRISHVEFVRIGSKIPIVLPQRVTRGLVKTLRRHRVWMSLHVTHPDELTVEATEAVDRLADAGLPLGSQTVLLKGVNDDAALMKRLMHELLKRRIKPYYLYQCDSIAGSSHFRTPISRGIEIIEALRGHTTGYAVPQFVVDTPGGKIPLLPEYALGREGEDLLLRNYAGRVYRYRDDAGLAPEEPQLGRSAG